MHFAGTYEVPVYSPDNRPNTIYNVQETLAQLEKLLKDHKQVCKMSEDQYQTMVDQFAHFTILDLFGVETYPIVQENTQPPSQEAIDALHKLKEAVKKTEGEQS